MLGIPGCGKSLCAKAVASDWQMPLLRLDPGVLYQKFIGESESQLRQALAQAEAMAPVVLWSMKLRKRLLRQRIFCRWGAFQADVWNITFMDAGPSTSYLHHCHGQRRDLFASRTDAQGTL